MKTERFELKLSRASKAIIRKAAADQKQSMACFILDAALDRARVKDGDDSRKGL